MDAHSSAGAQKSPGSLMMAMLAGRNTGKRKDGAMSRHTLTDVGNAVIHAQELFPPIRCFAEAWGVIREEYLEVEQELARKQINEVKLYRELMHLAAMCVRTIDDLGLSDV